MLKDTEARGRCTCWGLKLNKYGIKVPYREQTISEAAVPQIQVLKIATTHKKGYTLPEQKKKKKNRGQMTSKKNQECSNKRPHH